MRAGSLWAEGWMDFQTEAVSMLVHVCGSARSIVRLEWVGNEGACAGMKDEDDVKYQIRSTSAEMAPGFGWRLD